MHFRYFCCKPVLIFTFHGSSWQSEQQPDPVFKSVFETKRESDKFLHSFMMQYFTLDLLLSWIDFWVVNSRVKYKWIMYQLQYWHETWDGLLIEDLLSTMSLNTQTTRESNLQDTTSVSPVTTLALPTSVVYVLSFLLNSQEYCWRPDRILDMTHARHWSCLIWKIDQALYVHTSAFCCLYSFRHFGHFWAFFPRIQMDIFE